MNQITSFTIDHTKLKPGIYISRKDIFNNSTFTTVDIRMKAPNIEPVINTAEIHTIEHIGATLLRNNKVWKEKTLYFGPMGCRTGFYLILAGDYESRDLIDLISWLFSEIANFNGDVAGATEKECGNYQDHSLSMAKYESNRYLKILSNIKEENLVYP
ncbi:S-ribosylhomocysteine lyase [Candidatus Borreliella tachyglossi]|uniref:S-ribosylhomocysteine lyase n=1 Tax=Candidatus Borreliella tachyglossi TaxID=1964448 RepID=A0A2S1LWT3_9SPIR|nr:S-ribosylhomocysteine lyase [Candidatus Borreliella tachyglossi]AWG42759.1 S-ribosylhomocysteine lyase [Candidatus Borreliella tachyglossi]